LAAAGSLRAAASALETACALNPDDPATAWNRVVMELAADRPERALALLDSLPRSSTLSEREVWLARAAAEAARGRPDLALEPLDRAAEATADPSLTDSLRSWRDLAAELAETRSRRLR
jgi:hypothetical protein